MRGIQRVHWMFIAVFATLCIATTWYLLSRAAQANANSAALLVQLTTEQFKSDSQRNADNSIEGMRSQTQAAGVLAQVLNSLNHDLADLHFSDKSISCDPTSRRAAFSLTPINITCSGTHDAVYQLIQRIETYSAPTRITQVRVSRSPSHSLDDLQVTIRLESYLFPTIEAS
ncbi:MAG TPA: hypothetical protein VG711_10510 [Phycisphaerales bacterium]|nr:hypothetical protein [Phycisphaerales bacterium]